MNSTLRAFGRFLSSLGLLLAGGALLLAGIATAEVSHPTRQTIERESRAEPPGPATGEQLPTPILDATEVHAGDRVALHWRSLAGAASELELVFSIDDGRHYDVRVSP